MGDSSKQTVIWDAVNGTGKPWNFVNQHNVALAMRGGQCCHDCDNPTNYVKLSMFDPRRAGGVPALMRLNDIVFFDEAGITAGVNHGYLRPFCNCCMRTSCPWVEDSCCHGPCEVMESQSPPELREINCAELAPIETFCTREAGPQGSAALVGRALEAADLIQLCPCKQFFVFKNNPHCMVCIAAMAAGRAGDCMVCKEPGAGTKTSCCNQFLHSYCSNKLRMKKAECPHCKVKDYIVA